MTEIIDVEHEEVNEPGTDLAVREDHAPAGLFRTDDPVQIVARATETANTLADVVKAKGLTTNIQGKDHVRVEGWTLLGTMLGVFPVCVWTQPVENGWEARVEARTMDGKIVGAAEAQCTGDERLWKSRDDYALRSMAQTRATSKALRQPLGFVMTLAGFEATPSEEMPQPEREKAGPKPTKKQIEALSALIERLPAKPEGQEPWEKDIRRYSVETFGTARPDKGDFDALISQVEKWVNNEELPFA